VHFPVLEAAPVVSWTVNGSLSLDLPLWLLGGQDKAEGAFFIDVPFVC
jgi:hypothetical protein